MGRFYLRTHNIAQALTMRGNFLKLQNMVSRPDFDSKTHYCQLHSIFTRANEKVSGRKSGKQINKFIYIQPEIENCQFFHRIHIFPHIVVKIKNTTRFPYCEMNLCRISKIKLFHSLSSYSNWLQIFGLFSLCHRKFGACRNNKVGWEFNFPNPIFLLCGAAARVHMKLKLICKWKYFVERKWGRNLLCREKFSHSHARLTFEFFFLFCKLFHT